MSLSDYVKYMRAMKGGLTPWEIAEATDVPARDIHLIEVKHRRMGDEETLRKLAAFFEVPVEELTRRQEGYRKRLTHFLEESLQNATPVAIKLESGEELEGTVGWYSREAVSLVPQNSESGECIVQRGWIADWQQVGSPDWEVGSSHAAARPNHSAGM